MTEDKPTVVVEYGVNAMAVSVVAEHVARLAGLGYEAYPQPALPEGVALCQIGIDKPILLHISPAKAEQLDPLIARFGCSGALALVGDIGRDSLRFRMTLALEGAT